MQGFGTWDVSVPRFASGSSRGVMHGLLGGSWVVVISSVISRATILITLLNEGTCNPTYNHP